PLSAVEIRRGTDDPPIFFVHSGTGHVTDYTGLAAHFTDGQRVIGLQSRGLAEGEEPLTTVEEMARAYLAMGRSSAPHGSVCSTRWQACSTGWALRGSRCATRAGSSCSCHRTTRSRCRAEHSRSGTGSSPVLRRSSTLRAPTSR